MLDAVLRLLVVLVVVVGSGCVNDQLVRGGDTGSSSSSGDGTTTGCRDPGCGGTTLATDGTTQPSDGGTTTGTGDTTHVGMGDETGNAFTCEPCTADTECGDDYDNCVGLDELGPRCLFACPEAGCPDDMQCRSVMSVDGVLAMQCAPDPNPPACGGAGETTAPGDTSGASAGDATGTTTG